MIPTLQILISKIPSRVRVFVWAFLTSLLVTTLFSLLTQAWHNNTVSENLHLIFALVTSLSVLFAVFTYSQERKRAQALIVTDQVTWYREKIIEANYQFVEEVIKSGIPKKFFVRIENIEDFSLGWLLTNRENPTKAQIKLHGGVVKNNITLLIDLLNLLEDFSLRVFLHCTTTLPGLDPIKSTFVELVETYALTITTFSDRNPMSYQQTIQLYKLWKSDINRMSSKEWRKHLQGEFRKSARITPTTELNSKDKNSPIGS